MIVREVSLKIGVLMVALSLGWNVLKAAAGEQGKLKILGVLIGSLTIIFSAAGIISLIWIFLTKI